MEVNMDIKEEIIYPEDTVQIFMKEQQDIEDYTNIKQKNIFFKEFDVRDIKQENNLFVKEEFENGEIFGTEVFTNKEEDLSEVEDNASISTLGTSFSKKEKITCLGCHNEFVSLKRHFLGTIGTTCKQKYLENLDNSNYLVHIQKARKRKVKIDEFVFCKGCSKPFQRLLTHLNPETGKSCREFYSAEELKPPCKHKKYYEKNKERLKQKAKDAYMENREVCTEQMKECYQENREARKEQAKHNYQENREVRKEKMKENYQKNKEARKEQMKENYQKNREARKEQMKENYQKNRESRKNQLKENYIKRKLLNMETIDVLEEDDNNDKIDKDSGEDDSDDEEDVFAKEAVFVKFGNRIQGMPCEKAEWQTKEITDKRIFMFLNRLKNMTHPS